MIYGDIDRKGSRRRLLAGAFALAAATALTACTPAAQQDSPPAPRHFGPTGYGKLTITMTEAEARGTGDLQDAPVSTVLGWHVYSFVNGPKPDSTRMAADEELEKKLETADREASSIAERAQVLELRATSMRRMSDRLTAFMTAGGASFTGGRIDSIAAPEGAVTEAGIKRGSTVAELKAAYQAKGLEATSEAMYALPVTESPGWVLQFETENDAVKFMALNNQAK